MSTRVLLHVCCGPCAIWPVMRLKEQGFEVTALFHNPNIHPAAEYLRRREGMERVAERLDLAVIFKDEDYRPQDWFRQVTYREANRCFHCYQMRLERTLHIALAGNFDLFSTTLLYSRRQKHETIAGLGRDTAEGKRIGFLYEDFRAGWAEGIRLSKEWGIYRQDYCGCLYSEVERRMGQAGNPARAEEPGQSGRSGKSGKSCRPSPAGKPAPTGKSGRSGPADEPSRVDRPGKSTQADQSGSPERSSGTSEASPSPVTPEP